MTEQSFPITPPPELLDQWFKIPGVTPITKMAVVTVATNRLQMLATEAARWGADQQLEQCERYWMTHGISPQGVIAMRYALRPKQPSLKAQALAALMNADGPDYPVPTLVLHVGDATIIRRALEQLPND